MKKDGWVNVKDVDFVEFVNKYIGMGFTKNDSIQLYRTLTNAEPSKEDMDRLNDQNCKLIAVPEEEQQ